MSQRADEHQIYEYAKDMVLGELHSLSHEAVLTEDHLERLHLLVRIYAVLKDDLRADLKAGLLKA